MITNRTTRLAASLFLAEERRCAAVSWVGFTPGEATIKTVKSLHPVAISQREGVRPQRYEHLKKRQLEADKWLVTFVDKNDRTSRVVYNDRGGTYHPVWRPIGGMGQVQLEREHSVPVTMKRDVLLPLTEADKKLIDEKVSTVSSPQHAEATMKITGSSLRLEDEKIIAKLQITTNAAADEMLNSDDRAMFIRHELMKHWHDKGKSVNYHEQHDALLKLMIKNRYPVVNIPDNKMREVFPSLRRREDVDSLRQEGPGRWTATRVTSVNQIVGKRENEHAN